MRKVTVVVDENGDLHADFAGFRGGECEGEAERLKKILADLGLSLKPTRIVRKPEAQIREEIRDEITRHRRGDLRS
jgi:hypothetical protein